MPKEDVCPYVRAKSREYRLSRSLISTRRSIEILDRNQNGTIDFKVLLSLLLMNKTREQKLLWALELQALNSTYVNYLSEFFTQLKKNDKKIAEKFEKHYNELGIVISATSGHFYRLDHLRADEKVPKRPNDPRVRNITWSKYIDSFKEIHYDVSYRRFKGDTLSCFL